MALVQRDLRSELFKTIAEEENKYQLTPSESRELAELRMNNIDKEEQVDTWLDVDERMFDRIVDRLKRQYQLDQYTAESLLDGKYCGGRSSCLRHFTFRSGRTNIVYGIFGSVKISSSKYNIIVATYKNAFDVRNINGRPITEGLLEKQQRIQALKYFKSECRQIC